MINGDLQFHMVYLLLTVGIAIYCGSAIVYLVSGSYLYASLFPLAVVFSPTLVRNISYGDTAEIPQLMGLAVYLCIFIYGVRNEWRKNRIWLYILVVPLSFFLFLSKETSIVLLPALFIYGFLRYCIGLNPNKTTESAKITFYAYNLILHFLLSFWVLFQVRSLRGGYSDNYSIISIPKLWETLVKYFDVLRKFPLTVYIPSIALLIIILVLILGKKGKNTASDMVLKVIPETSILLILGTGFYVINLPWGFVLERYMLPAAFFFGLGGCILLGIIHRSLNEKRMFVFSCLLMGCIFASNFSAFLKEYKRVDLHYEEHFGMKRFASRIANDIIEEARGKNGKFEVLLDFSKQSPWMWMQIARLLNQEGSMNVKVPSYRRPIERLYLRNHEHPPEIILTPSDGGAYFEKHYHIIYSSLPSDLDLKDQKIGQLIPVRPSYFLLQKMDIKADHFKPKYGILKLLPIDRNMRSSTDWIAELRRGIPKWDFIHSQIICLSHNTVLKDGRLKPLNDLSLAFQGDRILLNASGDDPYMLLPYFHVKNSVRNVVLLVHMWSPVDTTMQVFYQTRAKPFFNEGQSVKEEVKRGLNKNYFKLPADVLVGQIRLDPGRQKGIYKLLSLEVRAIEIDLPEGNDA